MKKSLSRSFAPATKVFLVVGAIFAVSAFMYLFRQSVFRPLLSEDGVPIPFISEGGASFAGSITTLGQRGAITLREVSFDQDEISEILQSETPVDRIDFVLTPDSATISDGASFAQAITPGKKVFGYMYTSRPAATEREMADRLAQGESIPFAQAFPGTFFVSAEQRADGPMIANFEQARGVTFVDVADVLLRKNARYIIVSNSANTTFTARGLSICGNSQVEGSEQCDVGAANGTPCDHVPGGSCTYCSLTCTLVTSGGSAVCGNGILELGEQCDDQNTDSGDGCSATCQTETHLSCVNNMCVSVDGPGPDGCTSNSDCSPPLQPVCGNGAIETGEQCDDQNSDSGDGCSSTCQTEPVISWHKTLMPMDANNDGSVTATDVTSVIAYLNNIPPNTQAVNPYVTPTPRYPDVNNDGFVTPQDALIIINWISSQCGNGQVQPALDEECDDGNTVDTDSCSNTCKLLPAPF